MWVNYVKYLDSEQAGQSSVTIEIEVEADGIYETIYVNESIDNIDKFDEYSLNLQPPTSSAQPPNSNFNFQPPTSTSNIQTSASNIQPPASKVKKKQPRNKKNKRKISNKYQKNK